MSTTSLLAGGLGPSREATKLEPKTEREAEPPFDDLAVRRRLSPTQRTKAVGWDVGVCSHGGGSMVGGGTMVIVSSSTLWVWRTFA